MLDACTASILAAETAAAARRSGGSFLVTPERRADDLDAARRSASTLCAPAQARVPAHRRGARQAPAGDRGVDRHRRAHQAEADELLAEYRERLKEARAAGRGDRRPRAQGGRGPRARGARGGRAQARGAAGADPARHRGRDPPRDPGDPQRGRRPDRARHREGHAQDAHRGRPAPARRGGARRARLLRAAASDGSEVARWRRSPRSTRGRCSRSPRSRTSSTRCASSSAQFADALDENRELQVFFFSPYFSTEEKKDGLHKAVEGADEIVVNFLELLVENHRMPAIFRIRREFDALWEEENKLLPVADHQRRRARRATVAADRRRDRRADRPQGRADQRTSTPTSSAGSSCASATRSSTPPSATASNNFASRSPRPT